ncbi:MAG TPA: TonB-dependent receptor [Bacteroidetes bacterium]|nr:TonB-dependent receptor [Bacteroidota bacterium]
MRISITLLSPLLILFFSISAFSQSHTFSGYVSDRKTGERLIGATIYDPVRKQGTNSNEYGFFSLTLSGNDSANLIVSYVGFQTEVLRFDMNSDHQLNISLSPSVTLNEVVIQGSRTEQIQERSQMSRIDFPMEKLKTIPALFGEADLLKALQLLPGIQSGGEGSTGLYVRGGGPDQNLILLDGAPVYNVSHLFGFFSVFNPDAIKNVSIYTGGFPARYGGRLSSVLDISMKDGNRNDFTVDASVGVISSKLTLQGPIKKNKASFIISGRRTYLDILAQPFIRAASAGEGTGGYYFYDLNGKLNWTIDEKNKVYLSAYSGDDKFYAKDSYTWDNGSDYGSTSDKFKLGWGNITSTLKWNHQFNKKTFNNFHLIYTKFKFNVGVEEKETTNDASGSTTITNSLNYLSGVQDYTVKNDLDWIPSPAHYIKFGIAYTYHQFSTGAYQFHAEDVNTSVYDTTVGSTPVYSNEGYAYLEDDWELSKRLKSNIGMHFSVDNVKNTFYYHPEPRISLRYLINENISIKASFCTMEQYIHLLSNSSTGLPTDLWVPATDKVSPQRSWQPALGYSQSFKEKEDDYEFTIETYYKDMKGVIDYLDGSNFLSTAESWEDKVAIGHAWSYGTEFFLQKKTGDLTGWIGYTWSHSWRQFDDINYGKKFPYKYDRRHDAEIVLSYKLSGGCDVGITWVYGTGNAITLPVAKYFDGGNSSLNNILYGNNYWGNYYSEIDYFGEKNSTRMKAYHRLDIGFNWTKEKKWGNRVFSLGIYNVYSRRNPYFYYLSTDIHGNPQYKMVSLFPIIPSISYSLHFN